MKIIAIIQARAGSTRLPKKVLRKIIGKTVLEHVVARVKKSRRLDGVVVATTTNNADREIVQLGARFKVPVFCGSENDVLDRYYQAAKKFGADNIVRITSDCPLIDPQIIDLVIKTHLKSKNDYTANILRHTYPDGLDTEIFTFPALSKAWREARLMSEREHVTSYMINHPQLFRQAGVQCEHDFSAKRWTLDYEQDFKFIKKIYEALYKKNRKFGMTDIIHYLEKYPQIEKINGKIRRNEKYLTSLKTDKIYHTI